MNSFRFVEYIWLDGTKPVCQMRSKSRVVFLPENPVLEDFPGWNFDGSSTNQSITSKSDCILKPVNFFRDPFQDGDNYLLLCEVFDDQNKEHVTNTRAALRAALAKGGEALKSWIGFEQEYTIFDGYKPIGWPEDGYPAPQGPYYCSVGSDKIFGRDISIDHAKACMEAGVLLYGTNAEVMPGQWEFQVGYRGDPEEDVDTLSVCDHAWVARWLLHRVAEDYGVTISFDNKPVKGDWNGSGMHTNFSTAQMRDKATGRKAIDNAIESLSKTHKEHIAVYGDKLEERLTGLHETSSIEKFSSGNSNRSSSIRIPVSVAINGYGYIEDRRPGANADPYLVAAKIIESLLS